MLAFLRTSWRSWVDSGLELAPQNGHQIDPKLVQFLVSFLNMFLQILRFPAVARGSMGIARRGTLSEEIPRAASRAELLVISY